MGQMRYKVYFTPLTDAVASTYGDEIDVSDRITITGIGNITKGFDAEDYEFGVFYFSDITIKGFNHNGYFNDEDDSRSIFMTTRDRCKVRIVFSDFDITRVFPASISSSTETESITFRGLINEEATRINPGTDEISFKVLSRDSVLRTTKVSAGVVANNSTVSTALGNILNVPRITSILNFDEDNINPDYDFTIDDGSPFDNLTVKDALNLLLVSSNSILLINDDGDIIVRDRMEDETNPIINLYGKSDKYGRENIIKIIDYNTGIHRTFTSIKVNETEETDTAFSTTYGFRQKELVLEFVTSEETETNIANTLLEEFKAPRIELKVEVPTTLAKTIEPLDRVSVNYPLRVKPIEDKFLPIVGSAVIDDDETPLPYVIGSLEIPGNYGFKVIEIQENPGTFTSTLKLRQVDDLVFNEPNNCILGYSVIGEGAICAGGDPCDTYENAPIGAGSVGCSIIG